MNTEAWKDERLVTLEPGRVNRIVFGMSRVVSLERLEILLEEGDHDRDGLMPLTSRLTSMRLGNLEGLTNSVGVPMAMFQVDRTGNPVISRRLAMESTVLDPGIHVSLKFVVQSRATVRITLRGRALI